MNWTKLNVSRLTISITMPGSRLTSRRAGATRVSVTVMLTVVGWYFFLQYWHIWILIPVVGFVVNFYFGYVVFRTLGLLFRHFRARFPWKY